MISGDFELRILYLQYFAKITIIKLMCLPFKLYFCIYRFFLDSFFSYKRIFSKNCWCQLLYSFCPTPFYILMWYCWMSPSILRIYFPTKIKFINISWSQFIVCLLLALYFSKPKGYLFFFSESFFSYIYFMLC